MNKLIRWISGLAAAVMLAVCAPCMAEEETTEEIPEAAGYVLVMAGNDYRWFPLAPTPEETYTFTVRMTMLDGTMIYNDITVTDEGAYISESNCDNQDCVEMGIVTLSNKSERILGNFIVCLPHNVMLQLFTWEEIQEMMAEEAGAAE